MVIAVDLSSLTGDKSPIPQLGHGMNVYYMLLWSLPAMVGAPIVDLPSPLLQTSGSHTTFTGLQCCRVAAMTS